MIPAPKAPFAELRIAIGDADQNGKVDIDAVFLFKGMPVFDPDPINVDPATAFKIFGSLGGFVAKFRGLVGL